MVEILLLKVMVSGVGPLGPREEEWVMKVEPLSKRP